MLTSKLIPSCQRLLHHSEQHLGWVGGPGCWHQSYCHLAKDYYTSQSSTGKLTKTRGGWGVQDADIKANTILPKIITPLRAAPGVGGPGCWQQSYCHLAKDYYTSQSSTGKLTKTRGGGPGCWHQSYCHLAKDYYAVHSESSTGKLLKTLKATCILGWISSS